MGMMRSIYRQRKIGWRAGLAGLVLLVSVGVGTGLVGSRPAAAVPPLTAVNKLADATDDCNKTGFFGLEPWWHFMPRELGVPANGKTPGDPCGVRCFNVFVQQEANECGQKASDVPGVLLAIIDDLLRIAGLVAVGFVLVGSFQYVGSRGNAERTAQAQSTILSALTGLAVSIIAVALVSYIGNQLGG
jgi:hypothetical protein